MLKVEYSGENEGFQLFERLEDAKECYESAKHSLKYDFVELSFVLKSFDVWNGEAGGEQIGI